MERIFGKLGIGVTLKMNNRKILYGIAETIGHADKMMDITVAIDKLEKIGIDNVKAELAGRGLDDEAIAKLQPILELSGSNDEKLAKLREVIGGSATGLRGVEEMAEIFGYAKSSGISLPVELDLSLARGLNYYTGAIFEVKANDFAIGSICGGGRYDDLTGIFGMPDTSGVGISFGADRIYDVMVGLDLFPEEVNFSTKVLFVNLGAEECMASLGMMRALRDRGVATEIYPEAAKMKKQMEYANRRMIPYVVIVGSNELETRSATVKNMRTGETERMGNLLYLVGKTQTPCKDTLGPGAIVAVAKLKNTRTGDTLCDEKAPFIPALPDLPPQLITFALAPKEKGDEDKVYAAIQKLLDEDIMLKLARDEETSDILLSGMGQLHVEISVERARRRYKVEIQLKTPKVPYRETVRGKVQAQGRHKKQTGGRGQFGDCWIEMEGLPRGSGYVFEDAIVGGAIPRTYIPAIDKGIQESAARGFIAGYPVVDFKVRVYDGSYHNVDSSEMAFKVAGSLAFKKAMETLKPVLLEPIVLLSVSVPDEHMGDVIGDLSSRRGKVLGSDSQAGITEIKAHVPMSEILRYAPDLRSLTGGQGVFTMEFDHYEEAPAPIVEKVIAEHQKSKEDA